MKKCPFCAEEIQDESIKCRYCCEFLSKYIDNIKKIEELEGKIIEVESISKKLENALDLLGNHPILGPLCEKIIDGEILNLDENLNEVRVDEKEELRRDYLRYRGILGGLRDSGYITIHECETHIELLNKYFKNSDLSNFHKYESISDLGYLNMTGEINDEDYIEGIKKFFNQDKSKNESSDDSILKDFLNIIDYIKNDFCTIGKNIEGKEMYSLKNLLNDDVLIKYEENNKFEFIQLYNSISSFCNKYHTEKKIQKLISILLIIQGYCEIIIISTVNEKVSNQELLTTMNTAKSNITQGLSLFNDLKMDLNKSSDYYDIFCMKILEKYNVDIGVTLYDPLAESYEATFFYSICKALLNILDDIEKKMKPKNKRKLFNW